MILRLPVTNPTGSIRVGVHQIKRKLRILT